LEAYERDMDDIRASCLDYFYRSQFVARYLANGRARAIRWLSHSTTASVFGTHHQRQYKYVLANTQSIV